MTRGGFRSRAITELGWLLAAVCFIGGTLMWAKYRSPAPCEELRLYCDLAVIQGPARRLQLCEGIEYREHQAPRVCVPLLRALQKVETVSEEGVADAVRSVARKKKEIPE